MRMQHRIARRRYRAGFSLAECAFSLLLTAIVIIGGLKSVATTQRTRLEAKDQRKSLELAQRMMAEIRQAFYVDPNQTPTFGLESGELTLFNRVNYDDVDDFFSYTESSSKDKDGTTVPGSSGYRRFRDVDWVNPASPTTTVGTDMGLKRITVTVTAPDGTTTTLVGLRSSKGLGEQRPSTTATFVTSANAAVTVGTNTAYSSGVNLINSPQ